MAKKFENDLDQVEPWYGTKYKVAKIPNQILDSWRNAGELDDLKIPEVNEFIPTDFHLYPIDKEVSKDV